MVTDRLAILGQRVDLTRHVLAFFQGNRYLLDRLVTHVVGALDSGASAIDLYAGVGLFAISAAVCKGSASPLSRATGSRLPTCAGMPNGVLPAECAPSTKRSRRSRHEQRSARTW